METQYDVVEKEDFEARINAGLKKEPQMYSQNELESFVHAITQINHFIDQEKPDIILAPMMGAVPLVDALNALNPHFENNKVYYVPASSSLQSLNNILPGAVKNVLEEAVPAEFPGRLKIFSIDEVVSGASAVRLRNKVNLGLRRFARERGLTNEEVADIEYTQIGMEHGLHKANGKDWNNGYKQLRDLGLVVPFEVDRIITMDNPKFCPVRYKRHPYDHARNTPIVDPKIKVPKEYVRLLHDMASVAGADPNMAGPKNLKKILEHQRFVPLRYKT